MKIKKYLRNLIFIIASILFYLIWSNGGDYTYGKVLAKGIEKFTTKLSSIERVRIENYAEQQKTVIYCKYPDRTTNISLEYCLPIVLLFAWHFALFFDKRITYKKALKYFGINFLIVFVLQLLFPLLLFDISQSKMKSMGLFIGLQIFGFLVFFLILKDSLLLKLNYSTNEEN